MKSDFRIGIVIALPIEARCFMSQRLSIGQTIQVNENLVLHVAGMGAACAKAGALRLLEHKTDALISWGTAGGLCPSLRSGQLVVPEFIVDAQGNSYPTHPEWHKHLCTTLQNQISVHSGPLLQAAEVITTPAAKKLLLQNYQAVAVDMESAAMAATAQAANVPFMAIRAITDPAHVSLPTWVTSILNAKGKVKPHTFVQKFLFAPQTWLSFFDVVKGFSAAKITLQTTANLHQHFFIDFNAAKHQNTRLQHCSPS